MPVDNACAARRLPARENQRLPMPDGDLLDGPAAQLRHPPLSI
jgi:hypothetical protein